WRGSTTDRLTAKTSMTLGSPVPTRSTRNRKPWRPDVLPVPAIPTPYKLLLLVALVAACTALGYRHGVRVAEGECARATQDAIIATYEQTRADIERAAAAQQERALAQ